MCFTRELFESILDAFITINELITDAFDRAYGANSIIVIPFIKEGCFIFFKYFLKFFQKDWWTLQFNKLSQYYQF